MHFWRETRRGERRRGGTAENSRRKIFRNKYVEEGGRRIEGEGVKREKKKDIGREREVLGSERDSADRELECKKQSEECGRQRKEHPL